MTRRIVATFLWALAILTGGEMATGLVGAPAVAGPVLAALGAAFVLLDPTGRIWGTGSVRRIARIPEPIAPTDAAAARSSR